MLNIIRKSTGGNVSPIIMHGGAMPFFAVSKLLHWTQVDIILIKYGNNVGI